MDCFTSRIVMVKRVEFGAKVEREVRMMATIATLSDVPCLRS